MFLASESQYQLRTFSDLGSLPPDARLLFVTNVTDCAELVQRKFAGRPLKITTFEQMCEEQLLAFDPDIVATGLFAETFDVLDVAHILTSAEFTGTVLVLHPEIPDPDAILLELSSAYPALGFVLMPMPQAQFFPFFDQRQVRG